MTFRARHPELQELVRELELVRSHNLKIEKEGPLAHVLLFAEAALVCLTIERFARAILANANVNVTESDTLYNLLQRCVSKKLFTVPWQDQEEGIRKIKDARNTILHGNYEIAARDSKCATVEAYFRTQFAPEVERLYKIADHIIAQIDVETGLPR